MRTPIRNVVAALIVTGLTAACSSSDMTTAPASPSFAKGPGSGGAPPPSTSAPPTVSISSTVILGQSPRVGQPVNLFVVATSEPTNRKAPIVAVQTAPVGLTLISSVSVDSPHGGGPGYVEAQYVWTPSPDQIGLSATITITATTETGFGGSTVSYGPVIDAPSITGLAATLATDHIEVRWNPSPGGVAPISYTVQACYRNANIRPTVSTCDVITTTTDSQALNIPLSNPNPTVAPSGGVATYFAVIVTPVDAAGVSGLPVSANVQ